MEYIRLNKFIASSGHCSRRSADRIIEAGKVLVNGNIAKIGMKILSTDVVKIDDQILKEEEDSVLLVFNKPVGITCTTSSVDKTNVVNFINYPKRIYPIGRLDKYSEGLLLLTNKGDLVNGIMRSRYGHEKEYIVTVDKPVSDALLRNLSSGVHLKELNITTKPCTCKKISRNKFSIVTTQGLNRQIRRMCETFKYKVMKLKRIRILDIELGNLSVGKYRSATKKELKSVLSKINR